MNTMIRDSKFETLRYKLQDTDWNLESMAISNLEFRISNQEFYGLGDSRIVDA
jgi:hypothetical protein